jgi:acetyl esterase/lipase
VLTSATIPIIRREVMSERPDRLLAESEIVARDVTIPGYQGNDITVSVMQRCERAEGTSGPGIYYIHGGAMVVGNRWTGIGRLLGWIERHDVVAVTVEYHLAPEYPDPVPVEDAYAGLIWMSEHATELGIDEGRILVAGGSAGGGLAAGIALMARDRGGPPLCGQLLMYPMIDDRDNTLSTLQFDGEVIGNRASNRVAWEALLGERSGTADVSIYAAPSRATDLRGLPPAFIDCGSAEVFRDEDVAYASALWAAGGDAELHVWPGGYHGFDGIAPQSRLSQRMKAARDEWVDRILGG